MREVRVRRQDVKANVPVRLDAGRTAICLVRIDDDFYAVGDRCSHEDVSLSEGDVDPDERWIECWKHGSAFSLDDGMPQCLPAVTAVPVFEVVADGDDIVVRVP